MPSKVGGGGLGSVVGIAGFKSPSPMADFYVPFNQPPRYRISGVTYDSAGSTLGGVTVEVFETASNRLVAVVTSDASGNYTADVSATPGTAFFAVGYKAGSPDVAGTTRADLTATAA